MIDPITALSSFTDFGLNDLVRLIQSLPCSAGFEPSVKLTRGHLERRRGLFSMPMACLGGPATIVLQCRTMGAPESVITAITRFHSTAEFVHLGFEWSNTTAIGKCYLEQPSSFDEVSRLQFLGFKWSMNDSSRDVVSRYRTIPLMSWRQTVQNLVSQCTAEFTQPLESLLRIVEPPPSTSCSLLKIEDEGSDRQSFDLNLYDLELPLHAVASPLQDLAKVFAIPRRDLDSWLNECQHFTLGHLALGTNRSHEPFVTLYFGAREL